MDTFTEAFFSIFMIASGVILFASWIAFRVKTTAPFGAIRFLSFIPFALYGPLVVLNPWWNNGHLHAGYRFLGIWLPIWPIISYIMAVRSKGHGSMEKWETCHRSRGPFYILCVDLAILVFLIVDACRYPVNSGASVWTFGQDLGKVMGAIMIILFASQAVLLFPVAGLPRFIEAPAILIARPFLIKRSSRPNNTQYHSLRDSLPNVHGRTKPSLAALLQDDRMVRRLAMNLHYSDLASLSFTSRLMRAALFHPSPDTWSRQRRIESLCEASCLAGQKSECWACERVICEGCKEQRPKIPFSRVEDHFVHCYAVCTICYLLSAPGQPAPFRSKWKKEDLELQHVNCCQLQKLQWEADSDDVAEES
ncbi:hypothetical protein FZEAL_1614 [Fusarium zealandicum]|uniref:F-box domain-containing protein n=1 Tax=Fusarium zealandicum TaxID=1053134 RepID=A0A8H4XNK9_9HYPO|nr:hypothetical protein FZEAL_1614 [Fusarium zealandicum]